MTAAAWFSPLLYLSSGGGMLVALRYEDLGDWNVTGDDFEELADEVPENFLMHPGGQGHGQL